MVDAYAPGSPGGITSTGDFDDAIDGVPGLPRVALSDLLRQLGGAAAAVRFANELPPRVAAELVRDGD